ncbi:TMV resistance protein N-like [Benincasa hispida]|uniref:TMV resistance protein N-like n=1 Tax=Benincasa hispida TaxID=102211 RepID=UPI0019027230|nr:TMV resistance protein N-like [Benincasa hispida]
MGGDKMGSKSPEVEKLKEITKQIFMRCKVVSSQESMNLFGVDTGLAEMKKLLDLEMNNSNDDVVHFVGIVGMCGIGKTTLAEAVYDNILYQFWENSCFLRIGKKDPVFLQRQLLSTLLGEKFIEIYNEKEGAELIKSRLSVRKVLIVLDGIENKTQLENLAGSFDWFGPKSRIIITTRNKGLFRQSNYRNKIKEYNVELLSNENASFLFCKYALGDGDCDEHLKGLCDEIVRNIGGLPLALKEFALFLHGKSKNIWEEQLESLRKARNKRLLNILKLCFDGLEEASQQVFLDLACFFHGSAQDKMVRVLESLDYDEPHTEIQMLSDSFLIEVTQGNIFIPNFIQAPGQQIERNATNRTRVWI